MKKERIWELDALRGLCILGMVVVHLCYDLVAFAGKSLSLPGWFILLGQYGHLFFILISGICVTFSSTSIKRGAIVLCCALLVSYVTLYMDQIVGMGRVRIWFGILHLLGVCMLLYPLFRRLPHWVLTLLGVVFIALGVYLKGVRVSVDYLFPLGLRSGSVYTGSDYFPLFPGLGWFLLGAALGKTVYRSKKSLLPRVNSAAPLPRALCFCGRHSLEIYLVHQPILTLAVLLLSR